MTLSDSRTDRCHFASLRPLPSPRTGLPRLRITCLDVLCPIPRWTGPGAFVGCFPRPCCLPRSLAGSASMTSFSRPAQALHTLRPVDSLDRQKRPLSQGFDPDGYPSEPPASYRANRPLPGWDSHPRGDRAVRGAPETVESRRGAVSREQPVSPPRSSNRTCGFPASGFPTGFTTAHDMTPCRRRWRSLGIPRLPNTASLLNGPMLRAGILRRRTRKLRTRSYRWDSIARSVT